MLMSHKQKKVCNLFKVFVAEKNLAAHPILDQIGTKILIRIQKQEKENIYKYSWRFIKNLILADLWV